MLVFQVIGMCFYIAASLVYKPPVGGEGGPDDSFDTIGKYTNGDNSIGGDNLAYLADTDTGHSTSSNHANNLGQAEKPASDMSTNTQNRHSVHNGTNASSCNGSSASPERQSSPKEAVSTHM